MAKVTAPENEPNYTLRMSYIVSAMVLYWAIPQLSPLLNVRVSMAESSDFSLEGPDVKKIKPQKGEAEASMLPANPNAPISKGQLSKLDAESYIEKWAPIAQKEMQKFGIPASISLAQGLVESRGGTSLVCRKAKNHFGIKCFSKHHRACCVKAKDDHNGDSFRLFETDWESWRAHSKLLMGDNYDRLKKYGSGDYRAWAHGLKACGYATDRTYAEKLIGMIEAHDLHQYD